MLTSSAHLLSPAGFDRRLPHTQPPQITGHPNIPSAAAPEPPAVTRHAPRSHVVPHLPPSLSSSVSREAAYAQRRARSRTRKCVPLPLSERHCSVEPIRLERAIRRP